MASVPCIPEERRTADCAKGPTTLPNTKVAICRLPSVAFTTSNPLPPAARAPGCAKTGNHAPKHKGADIPAAVRGIHDEQRTAARRARPWYRWRSPPPAPFSDRAHGRRRIRRACANRLSRPRIIPFARSHYEVLILRHEVNAPIVGARILARVRRVSNAVLIA